MVMMILQCDMVDEEKVWLKSEGWIKMSSKLYLYLYTMNLNLFVLDCLVIALFWEETVSQHLNICKNFIFNGQLGVMIAGKIC